MRTEVETLDGRGCLPAFTAVPEGSPKGGIVVVPEIFGLNPGIQAKCRQWAKAGYHAIAPDLFWRFEPEVERDPDVPEEMQAALAAMQRFDMDLGVADIEAAIRWLRAQGVAKVAAVGFCLGGRLAYLAATRTDVDASVGYYPVGLEQLLGEAHGIARPLLLHVAGADHFASRQAQAAVRGALGDHPRITLHDYPGLDHGFAADRGQRRDETGAQLADARTAAFVADALG